MNVQVEARPEELNNQVIPYTRVVDDVADTTGTRWLSGTEQEAWRSLLGVAMRLPLVLDRDLKRTAGLTLMEYNVMALLSEADDRTERMSTIASLAAISLSRLSHLAGRLEQRGWVLRKPCPSDGRFTVATLTAEGHALLDRIAPDHVATVRSVVFDELTRDQAQHLGDILAVISRKLDGLCET